MYTSDGTRVPPASRSPVSAEELRPKGEGSWTAFWLKQLAAPLSVDSEYTGGDHVGGLVRQESKLEYVGERAYFSPLCLRKRGTREEKSSDQEREEELASLMGRNITVGSFIMWYNFALVTYLQPHPRISYEQVKRFLSQLVCHRKRLKTGWNGLAPRYRTRIPKRRGL